MISVALCSGLLLAQSQPASPPSAQSKSEDAAELVKQGQKLATDGKLDEALALYRRASEVDPKLYTAQLSTGMALDLEGKYDEARQHLAQAIELASADQKPQALRATAVSYAFECNTDKAGEFERHAFDLQYNAQKLTDAAGTADELARIYLECGDSDNAFQWYQTGHLTGLKKPDITPAEKDLWEFRWESALARIAARRHQTDKAQQHLAAAKAVLDKGDNPDQVQFYPYLAGYVALYVGDYKAAAENLQKANQKDPFVLSLLAQAYEKMGDNAQARQYYEKVLTINTHTPTNAFARPPVKQKLAQLAPSK